MANPGLRTTCGGHMSKRTVRSVIVASGAALGLAASMLMAGSASASVGTGELLTSPEMAIGLYTGTTRDYYHEWDVTFTCGVDGTGSFTGTGQYMTGTTVQAGTAQTLDGVWDMNARTLTYTSHYTAGYAYSGTGLVWGATMVLGGTATYGDIPMTGTWNGWALQGAVELPNCAPAPVVGNHGEYVSGAAHAGVKGAALAAIAKDGTLVGPYTG